MTVAALLPIGVLLPESILHSDSFEILATFVALNSLIYATLAVVKILPKGYALLGFNGRNRRTQNRSIYPEPPVPEPFDADVPSVGLPMTSWSVTWMRLPHLRKTAPRRATRPPPQPGRSRRKSAGPADQH